MSDVSSVDPALQGHLDKWLHRWPEWRVVEVFVPAPLRIVATAWAALQLELTDAAWGGEDARPGELKLAWWQEELAGWRAGRRRHPLGIALQKQAAPWDDLATVLPALGATRALAPDEHGVFEALEPAAEAFARVDDALLQRPSTHGAVALSLLHARLAHHPDGAIPDAAGDAATWGRTLGARFASIRSPGGVRGIWLALARARLKRGDALQPLPPASALWAGWRGARG